MHAALSALLAIAAGSIAAAPAAAHSPASPAAAALAATAPAARAAATAAAPAAPLAAVTAAAPAAPLVGAWYFGGWFNCTGPGCYSHFNGFTPRGARVQNFFPSYPERAPLLGAYSDAPGTIAAEIAAADAAGLDFFHVLYYDDDGEQGCGPNPDPNLSPCLNVALAFLLNTTSSWAGAATGRLHFALAYSNDVDRARANMFVGATGRAAWASRVATWVRAMANPHYLIVGARPVFQILIPDIFVGVQCGGDVALAEALLEDLRAAGRAAGVGAPVIGGGWLPPFQAPGSGAAPLPHPAGYMKYPGTDVPCVAGPCDLARVPGAAPAACMAACNTTGGCTAFAFYPNATCVLKSSAGPGARGEGDFYVRVLDEVAWEWRGTYNDAPPICYAGANQTDAEACPQYADSWLPNATADGARIFPYAEVLKYQADARGNQSHDAAPYLPNVIAGFDPRPWEEQAPSFAAPSQAEWVAALTQARDFVLDPANRVFGFPDTTSPTGIRPALSIYAWNEFGEGGILAPCVGDAGSRLAAITEVFGRGEAAE